MPRTRFSVAPQGDSRSGGESDDQRRASTQGFYPDAILRGAGVYVDNYAYDNYKKYNMEGVRRGTASVFLNPVRLFWRVCLPASPDRIGESRRCHCRGDSSSSFGSAPPRAIGTMRRRYDDDRRRATPRPCSNTPMRSFGSRSRTS